MNSSKWVSRYFIDRYAQQAKIRKLRSRAWFKLQFIDQTDILFQEGMTVLDLGSAPGGWSYYVSNKINNSGVIIACDILPMKKISGVCFIQGDCNNSSIFSQICSSTTEYKKAQIVLSDMSPNTTGISLIDVYKSIFLGNVALNICCHVLVSGGSFLVKVFQGTGFDQYLCSIKSLFRVVKIRKPSASRYNSREVYIVAKQFKCKQWT